MSNDVAGPNAADAVPQLRRGLSNRHIQLIAIGGAIGTGLFMGSGKTISLRRPGGIAGVRDHRILRVLRAARDGRAAVVEPELQVVPRLRRRPIGPCGRLFRRVVVLVRLGRHRYRGNRRDHRLLEILVARRAAMVTGPGHGRADPGVQLVQRPQLRGDRVLVRLDQGRRDRVPHRRRRRAGGDRFCFAARPSGDGCEPLERRRIFRNGVHGRGRWVPDRVLRVRGCGTRRHRGRRDGEPAPHPPPRDQRRPASGGDLLHRCAAGDPRPSSLGGTSPAASPRS